MWVEITSTDQELEQYYYRPLKSGGIYPAKYTSSGYNLYFDVYIEGDYLKGGKYISAVYINRLRVLTTDEVRDMKLNKLGINN